MDRTPTIEIGYHPNPVRGCGTKSHDACYAEGGFRVPGGALNNWTWMLGDGLERYISLSDDQVPPRQVVMINPIMSIMTLGFVPGDGPDIPVPEDAREEYTRLRAATKPVGIADHVGDQYYSAYSFFREVDDFGPSRRIPKSVAKTLAEVIAYHGPIPMVFAHSKIPVFRNQDELREALFWRSVLQPYERGIEATWYKPTWEHERWGMYARRGHWVGHKQVLVDVLWVIDQLKYDWQERKESENWQGARKFFKGLRYVKQTFGASWLCRVSYTLPAQGGPDEEILELPGVNIIDLDEEDQREEEDESIVVEA